MFLLALRQRAAWVGLSVAIVAAAGTAAAGQAAECPATAVPTAQQTQLAERQARDRGFLWRIERDGKRSWLFGTVHVARFEWSFPGPQLAQALKQARVLAVELDLSDPQALADALQAVAAAGSPALPPALRARLARRLAAECLPESLLTLLPPALQAATLGALAGRRDGLDPAWAIDSMLAARARAAELRIASLETLAAQLAALQGPHGEQSLRFVERTLDTLDSGQAAPQVQRIAEVWAAGDLAALERWPDWCDCMNDAGDRALMRRLLEDRNGTMAERIDALHREGAPVLAAVGALHMVGPQGLPALLAARGYRVERVLFAR
jgi:uncharacterized protein YbaP (TraB family)